MAVGDFLLYACSDLQGAVSAPVIHAVNFFAY
jgi:hypothetical protein